MKLTSDLIIYCYRSCFLARLKRSSMSSNQHNLSKYRNRFSDKLQNASPVLTFRYSDLKRLVEITLLESDQCISDWWIYLKVLLEDEDYFTDWLGIRLILSIASLVFRSLSFKALRKSSGHIWLLCRGSWCELLKDHELTLAANCSQPTGRRLTSLVWSDLGQSCSRSFGRQQKRQLCLSVFHSPRQLQRLWKLNFRFQ